MSSSKDITLNLVESASIKGREDRYVTLPVDVAKTMASWRQSLYAFEWLDQDGVIKDRDHLSPAEQEKYDRVVSALKKNEALEKPVLGIGMLDNVEIGAGRAVFLVLAAQGTPEIPVHIPKSQRADFSSFLA